MIDAETVISRLEETTATILAMPGGMPRLGVKVCDYGYNSEWFDEAGDDADISASKGRIIAGMAKPPAPTAAAITRADEIVAWLAIIPQNRYVMRKIVAARSILKWTDGKHVFSWSKLSQTIGADVRAVKRWHAQGIQIIVDALNAKEKS